MTSSPTIERVEFPSAILELPVEAVEPPHAAMADRMPAFEQARRPVPTPSAFGEAEWEKVAAGVLAGFGGGIAVAFLTAMVVL